LLVLVHEPLGRLLVQLAEPALVPVSNHMPPSRYTPYSRPRMLKRCRCTSLQPKEICSRTRCSPLSFLGKAHPNASQKA
jgi:hypothetical protein